MTYAWGDRHANWLRLGPAVSIGVLLLSLVVAGWAFWKDHGLQASLERERALIVTSERLLSALKDVETGERGFIITGRDNYLEPYNSGLAAVAEDEATLAPLLPSESNRLFDVIKARLDEAAEGIATFRRDGAAAGIATIDTNAGKALMDRIRGEIAQLQQDANRRIDALNDLQRMDDALRIASVLGLVLSCLVVGLLALFRRREQLAAHDLFEGVLENASVGVGILDSSLRVRHVNPALARMSERTLSVEPGMSIWEVIPQLRETLEKRLKRVAQGERAANADIDVASHGRDSEDRSYQVNFYPLRQLSSDPQGKGVGMVVADVTGRRRAERATKRSEQRFRSLIQASAAMIWAADATGAFAKPQPNWNRFTGQPENESLGWGRLKCIHPDDVEKTQEAWKTAIAAGTPIALEQRIRRADGEWRHMALSVAPVLDEDGTVREWMGSHTDITDRKEAEIALEEAKQAAEDANLAKSTFIANMSHELRTPLSAIIGYSEMMLEEIEDESDPASLAPDMRKIEGNARHLLGLINDVLDLSKVESGKMEIYAEQFEIDGMMREVASTVGSLVERKGNHLALDIEAGLGVMHSDVTKIRQVLLNLLGNAAKFTEHGTITLAATRTSAPDGDRIVFRVSDTGIGMTEEQLAKLFQRFQQADSSTTRKFGGTGLGLSLTKAFVEMLDGSVAVESVHEHGSTFTVSLPATYTPPPSFEADETQAIAVAGEHLDAGLVLVIDDDENQRALMTRFLHREGFEARTAADGATGLQMARELRPRAILLDVMMPGIDGWSVLSALKHDEHLSDIPVVMVTFVEQRALAASLGATDYVMKPVHWDRFKLVMDRFRPPQESVLVIDDDADTRERLRAMLEKDGWSVTEAENGLQGLERLDAGRPGLVLLDLTMPVMDGFTFLERMRARPDCSEVPVVVLTALDLTREDRRRLAGASQILNKGDVTMRALGDRLHRLAERVHSEPLGEG